MEIINQVTNVVDMLTTLIAHGALLVSSLSGVAAAAAAILPKDITGRSIIDKIALNIGNAENKN